MEELENLEETLNESIQESLGLRVGGVSHAKKKGVVEDEEEYTRYLRVTNFLLWKSKTDKFWFFN